jgi:hypothetical protein
MDGDVETSTGARALVAGTAACVLSRPAVAGEVS